MILFEPEIRETRRKMETVRQKLPIFDLSLQTERGESMGGVRVETAKLSAYEQRAMVCLDEREK
jgi:hypothetical protein